MWLRLESHSRAGFTLIELLVVIAIVGVLSSIVLASLNSARDKGADANIRANLANMRAQAELVLEESVLKNYNTVCGNANIVSMIDSAKRAAGIDSTATITALATPGEDGRATCHDRPIGWAVEVPLRTTPANFACVDFKGNTTITVGSTLGVNDSLCGPGTQ